MYVKSEMLNIFAEWNRDLAHILNMLLDIRLNHILYVILLNRITICEEKDQEEEEKKEKNWNMVDDVDGEEIKKDMDIHAHNLIYKIGFWFDVVLFYLVNENENDLIRNDA